MSRTEAHAPLAFEVADALVLWRLNSWVSSPAVCVKERIHLEIVSLDMCF